MKQIYRYLITQIWNERRSNIALLLELFIIACIMFIVGWGKVKNANVDVAPMA